MPEHGRRAKVANEAALGPRAFAVIIRDLAEAERLNVKRARGRVYLQCAQLAGDESSISLDRFWSRAGRSLPHQ